ncbi:MAG: pentapeptide repeat-containing protein [Nitrospira sp.]|nr:pentapeptide repeat-containing protein [Nitrospira sp.]
MDPIATWRFWTEGTGYVQEYPNESTGDGGPAIVGLGAGVDYWSIFDLGGGNIALGIQLNNDGQLVMAYWNSHFAMPGGTSNGGMVLWSNDEGFASNSIGPEQTFKLINMGAGRFALQITAGPNAGQYLMGQQGGWYPAQWGYGTGSLFAMPHDGPPLSFGLLADCDQLPILKITGSGYFLNLTGKDLTGYSLTADMSHCTLDGASLSGIITLAGANFTSASLKKAILSGLDLGQASTWNQADFTGTDLSTIKSAAGAHLEGAIFNGATLGSVSYAGAHLAAAKFNAADGRNANLTGTIFAGADLTGADLTGATLVDADFRGALLHGTIFDGCDLTRALFDDKPDFTRATTGRTTFQAAIVPFAILGKNWSYLDLTDATITLIPEAIPKLVADQALLPVNLDLQNKDFTDPDGTGASFRGTRMYGIQLQGANLQSAQLQGAQLKSAKLDRANLTLADLTAAWLIVETATPKTPVDQLEAASLIKAFMFNTVLDQAHCDGVDFTDAIFSTSVLSTQPASAEKAFMNDAKFNDAWVLGAIFNGAQLAGANFANAHLIGSTFKNNGSVPAELTPSSRDGSDASIAQADISGTDFTGANMDGLDMVGATVATKSDSFGKNFPGYNNASVLVAFSYDPTVFGNTTKNTTCPNGNPGPCKVT